MYDGMSAYGRTEFEYYYSYPMDPSKDFKSSKHILKEMLFRGGEEE